MQCHGSVKRLNHYTSFGTNHREKTRQIQKRFITRFVHTNHALNHIGLNRLPDDKSFVNPIMNLYLILYLINTQNH